MSDKAWTHVAVVCGALIVAIGVGLTCTDVGRYVLAMVGGSIQYGHL